MTSPMIHVVDDEEPVRENLSSLLRSAGYNCETYASAAAFLEAERGDQPGCILLDLNLGRASGLDLQARLADARVELPVIFMSGYGDVRTTVAAMKGGARDFLTKPLDETDLLDAVGTAVGQDRERRRAEAQISGIRERAASLTPREREVTGLVANGLQNKQIAARLGISPVTVKLHRGAATRKLGARTNIELVRLIARIGGLQN